MFSKASKCLTRGLFAILLLAGCVSPRSTTGAWVVPSLSQPGVPMIFTLHPDGRAEEKIGDYHGTGKWKIKGRQTYISWNSGWTGILRRTGQDTFELLTWKKGTPINQPPDDRQTARRLASVKN